VKRLLRAAVYRVLARPLLVLHNMAEEARRASILRELNAEGKNIALRPGVTFTHPERVTIGNNVMLNQGTMIFAGGSVTLGDNIVMGPGCLLVTGNHRGEIFYGSSALQPIIIGNNVWLGARVIVTPGVTIGNNVIVSAGAVVTEDLPDDTIYGGVPARKLKDLKLPFEPGPRNP
jgi:maltose O-acetyltransferase